MRILFIFLFILCLKNQSFSQNNEEWSNYLKDSVFNAEDEKYICLFAGSHNKKIKFEKYFFKEGKYIFAKVIGDSIITEKIVVNPNLFQIVYDNYNILNRLSTFVINKNINKRNYHSAKHGTSIIITRLGIRYDYLHFNHFPKFTEEQISKTKRKKIRKAMLVINKLYAYFEELEK
ncbi:MAG: hypothetical protein ABL929_07890 [Ferruginibacter sp.]|nr:hypothetical protein [Ferruginibacter sp.]